MPRQERAIERDDDVTSEELRAESERPVTVTRRGEARARVGAREEGGEGSSLAAFTLGDDLDFESPDWSIWEDTGAAVILEVIEDETRRDRRFRNVRDRFRRNSRAQAATVKHAYRLAEKEGKVGSLQDFLQWLIDNQDKIIAFIQTILGLFTTR